MVELDRAVNAELPRAAATPFRVLVKAAAPAHPPPVPRAVAAPPVTVLRNGASVLVQPTPKVPTRPSVPSDQGAVGGFNIRWPDDDICVDVRHLLAAEAAISPGGPPSHGTGFDLTPAVLAQVCANNALWPLRRDKATVVLFAIRGAEIAQVPSQFVSSVRLTLANPDHRHFRCTMGVWNRIPGQPESLRVWPGSTVPNAQYLAKQASQAEGICNLAPTGLHRFVVGPHIGPTRTISGAFRQGPPYPPHRLPERTFDTPGLSGLAFTDAINDHSRPELASHDAIPRVGNDLHPAFAERDGSGFSSAGCQVVSGSQSADHTGEVQGASGDWHEFRAAAGLVTPPGGTQDGWEYDYLLVNGREARLTAIADPQQHDLLRRFRYGSIDPPAGQPRASPFGAITVTSLQKGLAAAAKTPSGFRDRVRRFANPDGLGHDGKFFGDTLRLVLAWQAADRGGRADGIVDLAMLKDLHIA